MSNNDFQKRFPKIDVGYHHSCPCGKGWHSIIEEALDEISAFSDPENPIRIFQIKEKFGGLRLYIDIPYDGLANEELYNELYEKLELIVAKAEERASKTCEFCGSQENVTSGSHGIWWIKTLCESCHKERMEEKKERDRKEKQ